MGVAGLKTKKPQQMLRLEMGDVFPSVRQSHPLHTRGMGLNDCRCYFRTPHFRLSTSRALPKEPPWLWLPATNQ